MENLERSFDKLSKEITKEEFFCGRKEFLKTMKEKGASLYMLFGGRGLGKTSLLHAVKRNFLDPKNYSPIFPVYINLQKDNPKEEEHFLYLMIDQLQESLKENINYFWIWLWWLVQKKIFRLEFAFFLKSRSKDNDITKKKMGREEFEKKISRILKILRRSQNKPFEKICFLLDNVDSIIKKQWANDAFSYLRTWGDPPFKNLLGVVLAGTRRFYDNKEEDQSPLKNYVDYEWLSPLSKDESIDFIEYYGKMENVFFSGKERQALLENSGNHPLILEELLKRLSSEKKKEHVDLTFKDLLDNSTKMKGLFSSWWNKKGETSGFKEQERIIYKQMIKMKKKEISGEDIAVQLDSFSIHDCQESLLILKGTGVIIQEEENGPYRIGSILFQKWVEKQG